MTMLRHRSVINSTPLNIFHHPKRRDSNLSNLNQVYFVTKQVPQNTFMKPQLSYLPFIKQSPSIVDDKTELMSSELLSSVHTIDMDTINMSNKYFTTVLPPKRSAMSKSQILIAKVYNKSLKNSVVIVPQKTNRNLMVKNNKPTSPEQLKSKSEIKLGPRSTPIFQREKSARTSHSRALTYYSFYQKKVTV